jgi:phage tail sheath gpL-like
MASDAVSIERKSKVVGYKIEKGDFRAESPNLPQRIVVLGEANVSAQELLDLTAKQITSAQKAGELYGFGSPIHHILNILKPANGGGVGGIPIIVIPQAEADGATTQIYEITAVGTATKNGTHTVKIAGRTNRNGKFYDINIVSGDTAAEIHAKIEDAVNNVLGCPFTSTSTDYATALESKWAGLTAAGLQVEVDTNDNDLGITYTVESTQAGTGTPSIADALELFGNDWNTIVVNSFGTHEGTMTLLEEFNGIPDPITPTGRYASILMKPFIAFTGSVAEDDSAVTDARKDEVTIAICPAPLSDGLAMEAAANMAVLYAVQAQNNPHLDVSGQTYPDMPTPTEIGAMASYDERDVILKKGCSTVDLSAGKYIVQDFVTTYHPVGEEPPQFAYVRNLTIDFNIRYGYYLIEQKYVVDHMIANDDDTVSASKVVKPKTFKGNVFNYAEDIATRGLIAEPSFMQETTIVNLSTVNPDRLETRFSYKRSGYARISSTTATAGFNFGTLN